jgi:hypothetical protein
MSARLVSIGEKIVFGIAEPLPLRGFPPGKIRLRLRPDDFARAFVRMDNQARAYVIKEKDGFWIPFCEQGRNIKL